jgi:hypothetical protein
MKASELRIGNLIYDNEVGHKGDFKVTAKDIVHIQNKGLDTDYSFINLSEEWLVKFGFEDNGQSYEIEYCVVRRNYNNKVMFDLFKNGEFIHSELKHVHQLQNLYFALTGEELTIKEKG